MKPLALGSTRPLLTSLPASSPVEPPSPLDMPRLVMRRASWVALLAWLVVLGLGLVRAATDIDREVAAALTLATVSARLAQSGTWDEQRAIDELARLEREAPLRHLSLSIRDSNGAVVVAAAQPPMPAAPMSWLLALHRTLQPAAPAQSVSWPVQRGDGRVWNVTLESSRESERVEAIENLAAVLVIVALGAAALLLAMAVNVRRAFAPMHALLAAIAALRKGDALPLKQLPPMPVSELQAIRAALHALGESLQATESERRVLSHKVLTLQEDERRLIARELHDGFGQNLTALRADVAWLQRKGAGDAGQTRVLAGMAQACERLQSETRSLLAGLMPLGAAERTAPSHALRVQGLLEQLVAAWNTSPAPDTRVELVLRARDHKGGIGAWPGAAAAAALPISHDLALALYRISQEALTNVARHAGASRAVLQLTLSTEADALQLEWQVSDDGIGIGVGVGVGVGVDIGMGPDHDLLHSALHRGNGLAGIRERVWAFGADLHCAAASEARSGRPGLVLRASFRCPALAAAEPLARHAA